MAAELATTLTATEEDRLEQAEALVRSYCGWHIAPSKSESLTLVGSGSAVLLLPSLFVTEVTSVVDDGTAVDADSFYCSPAGVLSKWSGVWGTRLVVVDVVHGYATVPPEVSGVVQAVAQRAVDNPGSRPREQVGPFADTYSQMGFNQAPALALLDAEKAALARYRLPPRP